MGFFKSKKRQTSPQQAAQAASQTAFDDAYKEELRRLGRNYFKQIITQDKHVLRQEMARTFKDVSQSLSHHMERQLDQTIARVSRELSAKLERQLSEYDRMVEEAQQMATQSLTRNSQALHDKYEQLQRTLEQTISSQEATMITVFSESQAHIMAIQKEQADALASLKSAVAEASKKSNGIGQTIDTVIATYTEQLRSLTDANQQQLEKIEKVQSAALTTLSDGAKRIDDQQQALHKTVDQIVMQQKDVRLKSFTDNMAVVVEHYIRDALGDSYDISSQLPAIIEQLEADKQTMVEDIKL